MIRLAGRHWWMASRVSTGSKCSFSSVITVPPDSMAPMAEIRPVPCIRGGATRLAGPGPMIFTASISSSSVCGTGPSSWADRMVSMRRSWVVHITPLGMPVVPPV